MRLVREKGRLGRLSLFYDLIGTRVFTNYFFPSDLLDGNQLDLEDDGAVGRDARPYRADVK